MTFNIYLAYMVFERQMFVASLTSGIQSKRYHHLYKKAFNKLMNKTTLEKNKIL